ncbi:hypothetical protein KIN20_025910 [Parelaphostrongylus tenuis]|uniref:Nucleoporin Nup133/Nup155-like C-terminal domain-containing protein n=1 Tax=Parelaphostrongylus tenuis TaxID=148309 RepID=A0AAD5N9T8_PARTN|nr:hypothetical protein KIN20_025910 [Parelaphostrongylus tenuis]
MMHEWLLASNATKASERINPAWDKDTVGKNTCGRENTIKFHILGRLVYPANLWAKWFSSNPTNDLDLVLDRLPIDYPALVMETFLSIGKDEVVDDCATMGNGFCWMVSKCNVFVWNAELDNDSVNIAVQLPLPPSGLPYSARSVVVYKSTSGPPGVLVVSAEGVARHWPCVVSSIHHEVVIDLASEVTLSVQFLERSPDATSFLLTTTSGSIYLLHCSAVSIRGQIQWEKVASRETPGIGKRFSSIIFGSQASASDSSHVTNSLIFRATHSTDDSYIDATVVTISPNSLRAYDIWNKNLLWTVNIRSLLDAYINDSLKRSSRGSPITDLNVWLLDAAKFRDGILLLSVANHDNTADMTFFLALIRFDCSAPSDVMWFSVVPMGKSCLREFEVTNESSFIGRVFLCVPGLTAHSSSCKRTDGVVIIYPQYIQSIYLPDDLEKHNVIPLNKVIPFPTGTKLVGHACDERFCYVMTVNCGISCVRLLPKGFDDDLKDEKFLDDLMDVKESIPQEEKALASLVSAFSSFAAKNIVDACEAIKPLLNKSNTEFTILVYTFLKMIIDRSVGSPPETELKRKKVVCNRIVLFLRHMGVYDKVAQTKVLISDQRSSRTGASILSEMAERVSVAIALRDWELTREDRAEVLEQTSKRLGHICDAHYGYDTMIYSTLSAIHNVPAACADIMRELMARAVDKAARRRLVHICADMLLIFANAIELCRRTSTSVVVPQGDVQWTVGSISDAYLVVCKILLKELEASDLSQAERMRLKDCTIRLVIFHLSECNEPIDGHELIIAFYDLDECEVAVELAEKFKLLKVCLELNEDERRAKLDAYKQRFAADDFHMYLCRYLKRKNLNELLLEEKGERVDRYLLSCEEIRWRRELQNKQFEQASQSLLSLAYRESSNVDRQRNLYAFAKLAAVCSSKKPSDVIEESSRRLQLIKHQSLIPESLMKTVYPDNPNRPLTAAEMIELNLIDEDVTEGHKRALHLVASLLQNGDSAELRSQMTRIWTSSLKCTEWNKISSIYEVAGTPFGTILRSIEDDVTSMESLQLIIPKSEVLIKECRKELSANESATNWVRGAIERTAAAVKSNLDAKKVEMEAKKNVDLEIPGTYFSESLPLSATDNGHAVIAQ